MAALWICSNNRILFSLEKKNDENNENPFSKWRKKSFGHFKMSVENWCSWQLLAAWTITNRCNCANNFKKALTHIYLHGIVKDGKGTWFSHFYCKFNPIRRLLYLARYERKFFQLLTHSSHLWKNDTRFFFSFEFIDALSPTVPACFSRFINEFGLSVWCVCALFFTCIENRAQYLFRISDIVWRKMRDFDLTHTNSVADDDVQISTNHASIVI